VPTRHLPEDPSLENLRKQAKTLRKAVRARDAEAFARAKEFHPHFEEAADDFSLNDAQLAIAREYSFASWAKMKSHVQFINEYSWIVPEDSEADDTGDLAKLAEQFVNLACLTYGNDDVARRTKAAELFASHPEIAGYGIYTASTVGDVATVRRFLNDCPAAANRRGGPRNWEPLLYATYSRLNSEAPEHNTLEVARLLLERGANPNAGFFWNGFPSPFTALTGAFGEGEGGSVRQSEHQYCYELAELLLKAGADANDNQGLYNRMFSGGTRHLELLFKYGLGKDSGGPWVKRLSNQMYTPSQMLNEQMWWATQHNFMGRVQLLVNHGVDVNSKQNRDGRTPYELALLNGNTEIAQYLLDHGAQKVMLNVVEQFAAACIGAHVEEAEALLASDPEMLEKLGDRRPELLHQSARTGKQDAVRLMASLGFDLNEITRCTALHQAAWHGHLEMVKLMIQLGADPSIRDRDYDGTPAQWAAHNHQLAVVDYLNSLE